MKKLKVKCAKPLILYLTSEKKTHSHTAQSQWEWNLVTKLEFIMLKYALKYAIENFFQKKKANEFAEFECYDLWIIQFLILPTLPQTISKSISDQNSNEFGCRLPWIYYLALVSNEYKISKSLNGFIGGCGFDYVVARLLYHCKFFLKTLRNESSSSSRLLIQLKMLRKLPSIFIYRKEAMYVNFIVRHTTHIRIANTSRWYAHTNTRIKYSNAWVYAFSSCIP